MIRHKSQCVLPWGGGLLCTIIQLLLKRVAQVIHGVYRKAPDESIGIGIIAKNAGIPLIRGEHVCKARHSHGRYVIYHVVAKLVSISAGGVSNEHDIRNGRSTVTGLPVDGRMSQECADSMRGQMAIAKLIINIMHIYYAD